MKKKKYNVRKRHRRLKLKLKLELLPKPKIELMGNVKIDLIIVLVEKSKITLREKMELKWKIGLMKKSKIKLYEKEKTFRAVAFANVLVKAMDGTMMLMKTPLYHLNSDGFQLYFSTRSKVLDNDKRDYIRSFDIYPNCIYKGDRLRGKYQHLHGTMFGEGLVYSKEDKEVLTSKVQTPVQFMFEAEKRFKIMVGYREYSEFYEEALGNRIIKDSLDYLETGFTKEELHNLFVQVPYEEYLMTYYADIYKDLYQKLHREELKKCNEVKPACDLIYNHYFETYASINTDLKNDHKYIVDTNVPNDEETKEKVQDRTVLEQDVSKIIEKSVLSKLWVPKLVTDEYIDYHKRFIDNTYISTSIACVKNKTDKVTEKKYRDYKDADLYLLFNIDEHLKIMSEQEVAQKSLFNFILSPLTSRIRNIDMVFGNPFYEVARKVREKHNKFSCPEIGDREQGDRGIDSRRYDSDASILQCLSKRNYTEFSAKYSKQSNNVIIKIVDSLFEIMEYNGTEGVYDQYYKLPLLNRICEYSLEELGKIYSNYDGDKDELLNTLYEKLINHSFYNYKQTKNPYTRLMNFISADIEGAMVKQKINKNKKG